MTGLMKNRPGRVSACKCPSRRITTLSHWSATCIAEETTRAVIKEPTPIRTTSRSTETPCLAYASAAPMPKITTKTNVANDLFCLILIPFAVGFVGVRIQPLPVFGTDGSPMCHYETICRTCIALCLRDQEFFMSAPWYGLGFAALKSVNCDILKKLQIKTSGKSGNTGDLQ